MIWFYWDSILICWVKVIVYNALVSLINHRRLPSNCSTKIENKNWIISIKEASLKLLVSQEPVGRKSWAGSSKILGDCLSQFRFVKTFFSPFVLSFLNNFFQIKMLSNRLTITTLTIHSDSLRQDIVANAIKCDFVIFIWTEVLESTFQGQKSYN